MSRYGGFYKMPTVGEIKAGAESQKEKLRKKGIDINPIEPTGRDFGKSWWSKEWVKTIEEYDAIDNRLQRGKKYAKHHCVIDLDIDICEIRSKVSASNKGYYDVIIKMDKLCDENRNLIIKSCENNIDNIDDLINGKFNDNLRDVICDSNNLFPKYSEFKKRCNCPDSADLCKHIAATMYAIAFKFDQNPLLFFKLRDIEIENILEISIQNKKDTLNKSIDKSTRIINDNELEGLFDL